jgi:hypothetical protein
MGRVVAAVVAAVLVLLALAGCPSSGGGGCKPGSLRFNDNVSAWQRCGQDREWHTERNPNPEEPGGVRAEKGRRGDG